MADTSANVQKIVEHYETLRVAKEHPQAIILGNRCIYDILAYREAYCKRGWLSRGETTYLNKLALDQFGVLGYDNPRAIVVNPPLEVLIAHLNKRWHADGKKWNEEDFDYLAAAHEAYKPYQDHPLVLYIDHEIKKEDHEQVLSWVSAHFFPVHTV